MKLEVEIPDPSVQGGEDVEIELRFRRNGRIVHRGNASVVAPPEPGEHRVTVRAPYGEQTLTGIGYFEVEPPPDADVPPPAFPLPSQVSVDVCRVAGQG